MKQTRELLRFTPLRAILILKIKIINTNK